MFFTTSVTDKTICTLQKHLNVLYKIYQINLITIFYLPLLVNKVHKNNFNIIIIKPLLCNEKKFGW